MIPSVPYGWQPPGERFEIPSSRSGQFNVLGFLRQDGKQLTPYVFEGAIDTDVVIACMSAYSRLDEFVTEVTKLWLHQLRRRSQKGRAA